MKEVFIELGFFQEEIENLLIEYNMVNENNFLKVYRLLKKYNCHNQYIKEIIINRRDLFDYDIERLEYIIDAIRSNGDLIEETLLDLI